MVGGSFSLSNSLDHRMSVSEGLCSWNCVVVWAAFLFGSCLLSDGSTNQKKSNKQQHLKFLHWLLDRSLEGNGNTLLGIPERLEGVVRM